MYGDTARRLIMATVDRWARPLASAAFVVAVVPMVGCASTAPAMTGFLSDYSNLKKDSDGALRYVNPVLREYDTFIVAPVQLRTQRASSVLDSDERAEVARYMRDSLRAALKRSGVQLTENAGAGVGLVRIALTDVQTSKWYVNMDAGPRLTRAGSGGASMEGEVVDSVTGRQLGAVVQSAKGNQFGRLNPFNKLADIEDVLDRWSEAAARRVKELRERARH